MARTLTAQEKKLAMSLGLPEVELLKMVTREERKTEANVARETLAGPIGEVIPTLPMRPSDKSDWVGAALSFDLDGYGVKIVVTDKAATQARKDAHKAAQSA